MGPEDTTLSRRAFLRTAAGTGTAAAAAGAAGPVGAQDGTTHTVDMTDDLVFDPAEIAIEPGDTVVWENVGTIGHSVTAYGDGIPEEASFFASGGFDSEQAARDAYPDGEIGGGETYEHTFAVEGTYEYFCIPHEGAGMLGTVNVGTGGGDGADGGGAGSVPTVPARVQGLVLTALGGGASALALVYLLMKYGGDYGLGEGE